MTTLFAGTSGRLAVASRKVLPPSVVEKMCPRFLGVAAPKPPKAT
jgi:hypothetical protein